MQSPDNRNIHYIRPRILFHVWFISCRIEKATNFEMIVEYEISRNMSTYTNTEDRLYQKCTLARKGRLISFRFINSW